MAAVLEILVYALFFFAMALAILGKQVTNAILAPLIAVLKAIPIIGDKLASPVQAVNAAVTRACEDAVKGIEAGIGKSWHLQARLMDWLWREVKHHGMALLQIATPVGQLLTLYRSIRSYVHGLSHANHLRASQVKTMEHELHGIEVKLRHLEHDISKGIGEDVLPRLRSLDRELHKVTHDTIPAIRAAEGTDAIGIGHLWDWVKRNVAIPGTTVFAGAVAIALSSLGLAGLRCNNFTGLLRKFGCGLGTLLNDLLGLVVAGLALEGVCEFLPLIEAAFGAIAGPLVHILNEVPLGDCEKPPKGWSNLSVAAGPLPPAQTLGSLPS